MANEIQIWNKVMSTALSMPGVKVDRNQFLKNKLGRYCTERQMQTTLSASPLKVLSRQDIDRIAIDAQGAIPVLAVKDYEFRSVFEEKDFEHPPLKHISPIGNINCNEGWYYFKLQNEEELEVAKLELQELLKKDDE